MFSLNVWSVRLSHDLAGIMMFDARCAQAGMSSKEKKKIYWQSDGQYENTTGETRIDGTRSRKGGRVRGVGGYASLEAKTNSKHTEKTKH